MQKRVVTRLGTRVSGVRGRLVMPKYLANIHIAQGSHHDGKTHWILCSYGQALLCVPQPAGSASVMMRSLAGWHGTVCTPFVDY